MLSLRRVSVLTANVAAGNIVAMALFAVFMTVAAASMPVYEFGIFSAFYALCVLSTDFSDLGTGAHLILESESLSDDERQQRTSDLLVGRLVLHSAISVAFVLGGLIVGQVQLAVVAAITATFFSFRVLVQAEYRGARRYWRSSFVLIGERAVALALLAVLPVSSAVWAMLCLMLGSAASCTAQVVRRIWRAIPRRLITHHKRARHLGVSSLSTDLIALDVPILATFIGPGVAGLYAIPARLLVPIAFVGSSVSAVLLRELPALPKRLLRRRGLQVLLLVLAIVSVVAVIVAICAQVLIVFFLGAEYVPAIPAVQVAAIAAVVTAGNQVLIATLEALGLLRRASRIVASFSVLYLVCVLLGALVDGILGAVLGALVSQMLQFCVLVLNVSRKSSVVSIEGLA